jgi:flagellar export protein FliJ
MKGFVFRLERLFQLRARHEREQARSLGQAMRDEQTRRDALDEAARALGRSCDQIAGAGSVAPAGTLMNLGLTVDAAAQRVEAAETSHRSAAENVASERERFSTARKERRVVERLRERRQSAWQEGRVRAEQRELDEHAGRRRSREDREP